VADLKARNTHIMPYVSEAQKKWAHTEAGMKALGGKKAVHHWDKMTYWDKMTEGKNLPEHVRPNKTIAQNLDECVRQNDFTKFVKTSIARHRPSEECPNIETT